MKYKILLPTDFSKNAWYAITYALELYKKDFCDFYILNVFSATNHVIDSLLNMEPGNELYESAKLESENGLAKVLDMLAFKDYNNQRHHFKTISKFNNVVEAIKNTVEEKDIELIVMGTKGKTDSKKRIFGNVAVNVMENVRNCPVLVVPEGAKHHLPKEIVFPTSYKTHFKKRELNHLINLAKKCDAAIRILHVATEKRLTNKQINNKTLLEEYFKELPHTYHTLSHVDIPTAVNCFVESRASDMVAFINKKHSFFRNALSHPLVKEIGYNSKVPLLIMHDLRN